MRKNCWEVMNCGRQPGGLRVNELGPCPAAVPGDYDGINQGIYGGRFCWAISGTLRDGQVEEAFENKFKHCVDCKFLQQVHREEGRNFTLTPMSIRE